jgi:hypothetical protein
VSIYGLISAVFIASTYWEAIYYYTSNSTLLFSCFIIYVFICDLGLLCFVLWLFTYNVPLVFENQSLIEKCDKEKFPPTVYGENEYNMGKYKNFISVFGHNPILWFLPLNANSEGDGLVFAKNKSA